MRERPPLRYNAKPIPISEALADVLDDDSNPVLNPPEYPYTGDDLLFIFSHKRGKEFHDRSAWFTIYKIKALRKKCPDGWRRFGSEWRYNELFYDICKEYYYLNSEC